METGKVVNIMSADINQLQSFFFPNVQQLITGPITVVVAIVLLWFQIRWTTFLAFGVLLACAPVIAFLVGNMSRLRKSMLVFTDQRVKLMNQLLVAVRVLKMYAWEPAQEAAVVDMRGKELRELRKSVPYKVGSISILFTAPVLAMLVCFSVFGGLYPEDFTPAAIFTSISLWVGWVGWVGWVLLVRLSRRVSEKRFYIPCMRARAPTRPAFPKHIYNHLNPPLCAAST